MSAIKDVGGKLASLRGGTAIEAFLNAYQGVSIIFIWGANGYTGGYNLGNCQGYDTGGCTVGLSGRIVFFSFLSTDFQWRKNNVVHELGHLFDGLHGGNPNSFAGNYASDRKQILRPFEGTTAWQMHPIYDPDSPFLTNSEMFADMFVAWTYGAWNTNPLNSVKVKDVITKMDEKMSGWLH